MLGTMGELGAVALSEVEAAVGSRAYARGRGYARGNRVAAIEWDLDAETVTGSVVGQGAIYSTTAFFGSEPDGALTFDEGECSCPVGYDCKHVAALVIAATDARSTGQAMRPSRRVAPAAQPTSWETPLRALLSAPAVQATGNPLAIELALRADGPAGRGATRLLARLMRPGARDRWVNGSLTWSRLEPWHVQSGEYRPDHVALARELYVVHRAREGRAGYYYHCAAGKTRICRFWA